MQIHIITETYFDGCNVHENPVAYFADLDKALYECELLIEENEDKDTEFFVDTNDVITETLM